MSGFKQFSRENSETTKLFQRHDGKVYRAIGYILDPAICLEDIATGERHTVIINAPIAQEYTRLEPVSE